MTQKGSHYVKGAGMTRGELDGNLRLFVLYVEKEKAPPAWLLRFIAEGVERYRKEREDEQAHGLKPTYGPLWPVQTLKRGYDTEEVLKAAAMEEIGKPRDQAARLLGLDDISESSYYRRIKKGQKQRDLGAHIQPWLYRHVIEELIEDDGLTGKEREALRQEAERADPNDPEDDREPRYGE